MPNWCSNTLNIHLMDDSEDMEKLKKIFEDGQKKEGEPFLAAFYPKPEGEHGHWQSDKWGTKWDVDINDYEIDREFAYFQFESAWAPPSAWMEKISEDFPGLDFSLKYDEPGMGFMGVDTAKAGELEENCLEY